MECHTQSHAVHGWLLAQLSCSELATAVWSRNQVSQAFLATSDIRDLRPRLLVLSSKRGSPPKTGLHLRKQGSPFNHLFSNCILRKLSATGCGQFNTTLISSATSMTTSWSFVPTTSHRHDVSTSRAPSVCYACMMRCLSLVHKVWCKLNDPGRHECPIAMKKQ